MQPAPSASQHRRLVRINTFIQRQDRIIYILLISTAALGLSWVIWRHQHLLNPKQLPHSAAQPTEHALLAPPAAR